MYRYRNILIHGRLSIWVRERFAPLEKTLIIVTRDTTTLVVNFPFLALTYELKFNLNNLETQI